MTQLIWVLRTFFSYWRRSPVQFITLIFGLVVATALWSGVQAINQQARQSYDKAALNFNGSDTSYLATPNGTLFSQSLFIDLRLAGWNVSPLLEGKIELGGTPLTLIGVEPISLAQISRQSAFKITTKGAAPFIKYPGLTYVSEETLNLLQMKEGERPSSNDGMLLPPLHIAENLAPKILMVDIGIAQLLLKKPGRLSRLLIGPSALSKSSLSKVSHNTLEYFEGISAEGDLKRLTDSFHLNLTAFGFLSFFVGLFIVHSATGLAFEGRRQMIRTLRSCGVSLRNITFVLLFELLIISIFSGLLGVALGYFIAASLLPDVSASLNGLYGAQVNGDLNLDTWWWGSGITMSVAGALVAAGSGLWKASRLPLLASALPAAWFYSQQKWLRIQSIIALILITLFLITLQFGDTLYLGFIMMGCLLLGAALLQPPLLALLLKFGELRAKHPIAQWFWADSRQQLPGLSFALMALLLALGVNIGVGAMVESFRSTFSEWLDRRLAPEIYFAANSDAQALEIRDWLEHRGDVHAILPIRRAQISFRDWPTQIYGFKDHDTYRQNWQLLDKEKNVWDQVKSGKAALISEQLARRFNISVGDKISISKASTDWTLHISGIFPDYGNPKGVIMVNIQPFLERWPATPKTRHGIRTDKSSIPDIMKGLKDKFDLSPAQLFDQATLKAQSANIFEKTFAITTSLNTLTLSIAGAAMLTSLLTLSSSRITSLAPLWAIGLTRRHLAWIELLKALMLAIFTALLALPLGLLLSWCLVAVINVQAFGWRLPYHIYPAQWGHLLIMTFIVAILATLMPIIRLARTPPAQLLKVFSNER
ncbi:MAG: ABC transporter permease [Sneathiella sp.]